MRSSRSVDRSAFERARSLALDLLEARPPLLIVADFDGTLSPIVTDPMSAVIEPIGRRALRRLGRVVEARPDLLAVAILSGRTSLDVARRVRVGGIRYVGSHGMESATLARRARPERLAVDVDPSFGGFTDAATALADAVAGRLRDPDWLVIEPKGPSVALHYRRATDPAAARRAILEAVAAAKTNLDETDLVPFEGRRVVELRPAAAGGKGDATARLIEHVAPGAVIVLGDDATDAEAFEAVRAARAKGKLASLVVAVHGGSEAPATVAAAADVELESPRDAARLLSAVAAALERQVGFG